MPALTDRFDDAYRYAAELHREDRRKGTDIPYLTHLISVAALVLEDGGDETQAMAALLHDAAEDHPLADGPGGRLREIEERFGAEVAGLVAFCTDHLEVVAPPSHERKDRYVAHLRTAEDHGGLRVSLADKLHNARSIARDLRVHGDALWDRFNTDPAFQLHYYRGLVGAFRSRAAIGFASPMLEELDRVVAEIESLMPERAGPA
jgi:(p)ppGpp synthase/HD superfamily hydrolase